ncbi:MAG: hypothetical protein HUN04_16375 [Desulfobacter sp.]|nr:MAG: hypothetical protein HUN04_16375 [Desulfobacter sp.]
MEAPKETSFDMLAEKFLGTGFPRHLAGAVSLSELPPEARGAILRLLDLMRRSGYSITQFNPLLIRWLSATLPSILPGAWGGHIPPITTPGRHRKLDDYIAAQNFPAGKGQNIFMDIGCGFPPVTTIETAYRFPDWQIYGVDRSFADYVVYDTEGQYACFDRAGKFLYVHPSMAVAGKALYADTKRIQNRFSQLFRTLFPQLRNGDPLSSERVEAHGNTLIRNHIMDFETDNLKFIKSDLMALTPMTAKVFRCMNLFLYFSPDVRKKMLYHIKGHLENRGLLIIGTNSFGIQDRYMVYEKNRDRLVLREFAFSLDNLGHIAIMPWFSIHDNDPETLLLAELLGTLRSSPSFWPRFSADLDQLLEYHGCCKRKPDGFLQFPQKEMPPNRFLEKNALLWREMRKKGYTQGGVEALEKAGYDAWVNPVGDIAVRPSAGFFS